MCSYCEGGDGPPNDDDDDSTALMWVTEAAATMDALRFYARQSTCEPDGSLGLVTVQGTDGSRVALMQWVLQGKLGRVADIDESFRVKAIVPVGAKKIQSNHTSQFFKALGFSWRRSGSESDQQFRMSCCG
jgi:hypothetical protein